MKVHAIREKRALLTVEARALLTAAETESRELTAEQRSRFDAIKGEVVALEADEGRAQFLADAERRMTGDPVTGGGDKNFDAECRAFSLTKAIASQLPNSNVDAGREREVSIELRKRSGRTGDGIMVPLCVFEERVITTALPAGGPGGNLIGTDYRGDLYFDRLRASLRIKQLGATALSNLTGNVDIPNLKTSATAAWVAENSAIPASDLAFGKASLTPRHAGAITEFSRNMILQSSPDIETLVRNDFAQVLAEAVDKAAIDGAGGIAPTGILTLKPPTAITGPTWLEVLGQIALLENVNASGTGWLVNPSSVKKLRSTPMTATDTASNMLMSTPTELGGYPLLASTLMPAGVAIFGNWSDLLIGYWSAFDLLVNPYESGAYSKGNISIRAMVTCDVAVRHPESFAVSSGW